MRIAMAQLNPTVGDIDGNTRRINAVITRAVEQGVELLVTPELSVIGYPPRDLLLKPSVLRQMEEAIARIAEHSRGITTLVGYARQNSRPPGRMLYNAVAVLRDGALLHCGIKSLLPTYDVFDESRYFEPGPKTETFMHGPHRIGLSICEDLWNDEQMIGRQLYHFNPVEALAKAGANILVNISASPFTLGKNDFRRKLISHQARRWNMPIVYVNQVGANDELIFDGCSMAFDAAGNLLAQGRDFEEDLVVFDLPGPVKMDCRPPRNGIASVHAALVLGVRDYAHKCGFKTAVLGLSGGIDSAVVAALATEALGKENVTGVALPSRYSSEHSLSDARQLARTLGIHFHVLPIETAHHAMESALQPLFQNVAPGLAEENLQARIRGNLLMALSNKFGHLLLTTGNKSEVATGYCTLYGDMCGGLAVISDVPKMMVYELARYINAQCQKSGTVPPIPEGSLTKPPSAELRPNQTDQDSLPAYPILDAILHQYVEEEKSVWEIIAAGFDKDTVLRVARLVDLNEYKRKQMPPGLKVTSRAFGYGRRMPIAQRYDPAAMATEPDARD